MLAYWLRPSVELHHISTEHLDIEEMRDARDKHGNSDVNVTEGTLIQPIWSYHAESNWC